MLMELQTGDTRQVETSAAQIGLTRQDSSVETPNPNFVEDEADEYITTVGEPVISGGFESTSYRISKCILPRRR